MVQWGSPRHAVLTLRGLIITIIIIIIVIIIIIILLAKRSHMHT